jgi:UDP:flavonoid glycosyltransferase YjiC (YdhE family)
MKILLASTPAMGHLNPMLAIGRILIAGGHDVVCLSGSVLRDRIEGSGAKFRPLPHGADLDFRDLLTALPQLKGIPPGLEWLRIAMQHGFVDTVRPQHEGLLQNLPADVIVADDGFFGVLPMLLGSPSKRPPLVVCGTSLLHWRREDGAPHFVGLSPATTKEQREEYAAITKEYDRLVDQPVSLRLNEILKALGVGPLSIPIFDSVVELADSYMQLTVPSFEYPRDLPLTVNFVGTPPIIPGQVPLPPWANELDGSRKVVLVTQGTVANHDFSLLIAPTLEALANEPDLLVVATAGGRPIDAIPGPIPSNARLASYLPFEWALPKADVFVTNGGYGSVNQALSFGIPLVTAGMTEDKADVNARVAWSGVGINLATNNPTSPALREAVRTVLDKPDYRSRASSMADEFSRIDTRSEIIRIITQASRVSDQDGLPRGEAMLANRARRR